MISEIFFIPNKAKWNLKVFDVFVSFNHNDVTDRLPLIIDALRNPMERETGISLCCSECGDVYGDLTDIFDQIHRCSSFLIVMSHNALLSQWCLREFVAAFYDPNIGPNNIVPVFMDDSFEGNDKKKWDPALYERDEDFERIKTAVDWLFKRISSIFKFFEAEGGPKNLAKMVNEVLINADLQRLLSLKERFNVKKFYEAENIRIDGDIDSLYVPRSIKDEEGKVLDENGFVQRLASSSENALLVASAGIGKTELLKGIKDRFALFPSKRALLVSLLEYSESKLDIFSFLLEKLKKSLVCHYDGDRLNGLLRSRDITILFDGYDEILDSYDRKAFRKELRAFLNREGYENVRFLISCRYASTSLKEEFDLKEYRLLGFGEKEIVSYASELFLRIESTKAPSDFSSFYARLSDIETEIKSNPLFLTQITFIYKIDSEILHNKIDVLERMASYIGEIDKDNGVRDSASYIDKKTIDSLLPLLAFRANYGEEGEDPILDFLIDANPQKSNAWLQAKAEEIKQYLEARSILIDGELALPLFNDYYSARYLFDQSFFINGVWRPNGIDILRENAKKYQHYYGLISMLLYLLDKYCKQEAAFYESVSSLMLGMEDFESLFDARPFLRHQDGYNVQLLRNLLASTMQGRFGYYEDIFYYACKYHLSEAVLPAAQPLLETYGLKLLSLTRDLLLICFDYLSVYEVTDDRELIAFYQNKANAFGRGYRNALNTLFFFGEVPWLNEYEGNEMEADSAFYITPFFWNLHSLRRGRTSSRMGEGAFPPKPFEDEIGMFKPCPLKAKGHIGLLYLRLPSSKRMSEVSGLDFCSENGISRESTKKTTILVVEDFAPVKNDGHEGEDLLGMLSEAIEEKDRVERFSNVVFGNIDFGNVSSIVYCGYGSSRSQLPFALSRSIGKNLGGYSLFIERSCHFALDLSHTQIRFLTLPNDYVGYPHIGDNTDWPFLVVFDGLSKEKIGPKDIDPHEINDFLFWVTNPLRLLDEEVEEGKKGEPRRLLRHKDSFYLLYDSSPEGRSAFFLFDAGFSETLLLRNPVLDECRAIPVHYSKDVALPSLLAKRNAKAISAEGKGNSHFEFDFETFQGIKQIDFQEGIKELDISLPSGSHLKDKKAIISLPRSLSKASFKFSLSFDRVDYFYVFVLSGPNPSINLSFAVPDRLDYGKRFALAIRDEKGTIAELPAEEAMNLANISIVASDEKPEALFLENEDDFLSALPPTLDVGDFEIAIIECEGGGYEVRLLSYRGDALTLKLSRFWVSFQAWLTKKVEEIGPSKEIAIKKILICSGCFSSNRLSSVLFNLPIPYLFQGGAFTRCDSLKKIGLNAYCAPFIDQTDSQDARRNLCESCLGDPTPVFASNSLKKYIQTWECRQHPFYWLGFYRKGLSEFKGGIYFGGLNSPYVFLVGALDYKTLKIHEKCREIAFPEGASFHGRFVLLNSFLSRDGDIEELKKAFSNSLGIVFTELDRNIREMRNWEAHEYVDQYGGPLALEYPSLPLLLEEKDQSPFISIDGLWIEKGSGTLVQVDSEETELVIPPSVTIDGVEYPITTIHPNAFSSCDGIERVEILANIAVLPFALFTAHNFQSIVLPDAFEAFAFEEFPPKRKLYQTLEISLPNLDPELRYFASEILLFPDQCHMFCRGEKDEALQQEGPVWYAETIEGPEEDEVLDVYRTALDESGQPILPKDYAILYDSFRLRKGWLDKGDYGRDEIKRLRIDFAISGRIFDPSEDSYTLNDIENMEIASSNKASIRFENAQVTNLYVASVSSINKIRWVFGHRPNGTVKTMVGAGRLFVYDERMGDYSELKSLLVEYPWEAEAYCFSGIGTKSIEEIVIAGSVGRIHDDSFDFLAALRKLIIEEGVESIGKAFCGCPAIEEIILPSSLLFLDPGAFESPHSNLRSVICHERFKDYFDHCGEILTEQLEGNMVRLEISRKR